ncbi:MAG: hypothetical protein WKF59_20045 [Chitinophagaceae bacterium]
MLKPETSFNFKEDKKHEKIALTIYRLQPDYINLPMHRKPLMRTAKKLFMIPMRDGMKLYTVVLYRLHFLTMNIAGQ